MKYGLGITVFVSGAVVMILEIVGSRVLAPFIGTSIFVWTSLIGIILGGLSIGYWLGGYWGDKKHNLKILSLILLGAGVIIILMNFSKSLTLSFLQSTISDLRTYAVVGATVLFAPPSIVLGMILPYATRLALTDINTSGRTVGRLYALSTLGSITGTFLAGFVLLSHLGTTRILFMLGAAMLALSLMICVNHLPKIKIFFLALALLAFSGTQLGLSLLAKEGVVDVDSQYSRILIQNGTDPNTGRPIRALITDAFGIQALMFLDGNDDLVSDYLKYYRLAEHFAPPLKHTLMLGGGAYTLPRDFLRRNPKATVDVVEIDPKFTELAQEYFFLEDDPRMSIYHEDGRTYLNRNTKQYDAIFVDVFRSSLSIPYQIITREATQLAYDALREDGIIMTNILSAITGERGKMFRAVLATYKDVFDYVYAFRVNKTTSPAQNQNIMVVGIKSSKEPVFTSENTEFSRYLDTVWKNPVALDVPILTDEFAPVDQYLAALMP